MHPISEQGRFAQPTRHTITEVVKYASNQGAFFDDFKEATPHDACCATWCPRCQASMSMHFPAELPVTSVQAWVKLQELGCGPRLVWKSSFTRQMLGYGWEIVPCSRPAARHPLSKAAAWFLGNLPFAGWPSPDR